MIWQYYSNFYLLELFWQLAHSWFLLGIPGDFPSPKLAIIWRTKPIRTRIKPIVDRLFLLLWHLRKLGSSGFLSSHSCCSFSNSASCFNLCSLVCHMLDERPKKYRRINPNISDIKPKTVSQLISSILFIFLFIQRRFPHFLAKLFKYLGR